jgi:hypothetical protein
MKIQIPDVTLLAVSSIKIDETIKALQKSCEGIDFGAVKIITHELPKNLPENIVFEECSKLKSVNDYSLYVFKYLTNHVNTSHCLLIQYDSWILNSIKWDNSWLKFDYCGGLWPIVENSYIANDGTRSRVGNGGFSLRSKKLMQIPLDNNWELRQEQNFFNEDGNVCCYYKKELLELGIKYAPIEVAAQFSFENVVQENLFVKPFGFHKHLPPWDYLI